MANHGPTVVAPKLLLFFHPFELEGRKHTTRTGSTSCSQPGGRSHQQGPPDRSCPQKCYFYISLPGRKRTLHKGATWVIDHPKADQAHPQGHPSWPNTGDAQEGPGGPLGSFPWRPESGDLIWLYLCTGAENSRYGMVPRGR